LSASHSRNVLSSDVTLFLCNSRLSQNAIHTPLHGGLSMMWMDDINEADCLNSLASQDVTAGSIATVLLPSDTAEHILERCSYAVHCETGDSQYDGLSTLTFTAPPNKRLEFLDLLQVSLFATQFHRADMMHTLTSNSDGIDDRTLCSAFDVLMAQQVPSDQLCRASVRNSLFASTRTGDYDALLDRLLYSQELGHSADIMRAVWGPTVECGALQNPGVDQEAWMADCIKGEGGLIAPTECVFRAILVGYLLKNGHAAESINQDSLIAALQELHDADDTTKAAILESSLVGFCLFNRTASNSSEDDELLTACLGEQMVKGVPADKIGKWVRHIFNYLASVFPGNVGHDVLDFMKMLLDRGLNVGQMQKTLVNEAIDAMLPDDPIVRNNLSRGMAMNSVQAKQRLLRSVKLSPDDDVAAQATYDTFWNEHDQLNHGAEDVRVKRALHHFQRIHGRNWEPRDQREPVHQSAEGSRDFEDHGFDMQSRRGRGQPFQGAPHPNRPHAPRPFAGYQSGYVPTNGRESDCRPMRFGSVDLDPMFQDLVDLDSTPQGSVDLDSTLEDAVDLDSTLEDAVDQDPTLEDAVDQDPTLEDAVDLDPTLEDAVDLLMRLTTITFPRRLHQGGTRLEQPAQRSP
ncbi:MAG: uncharacterized protein KVP18_004646, partial [Porospora cf. gigantea A]|uniref:uncharacterized protein n=2 Tax=Porospora cf. gigantea A TaxID=2853593 RepID=UPI0035598C59